MRSPYPIVGRNPIICGRKFCAGCGHWRHAIDFAVHQREPFQLNSRCHACVRIAHVEQSEAQRERRRAYGREWQENKRRKAGVPPREKYTAARMAEAEPILGRTNCRRCGRWRPVSDFGHHRGAMRSVCSACLRKADRAAKARRSEKQRELRREYERIYREGQRRQAGIPERNWRTRQAPPDPHRNGNSPPRRLPTDPLRPHIEAWLRGYAAEHHGNGHGGNQGITALTAASGVAERRIWGLLESEYDFTHYTVADRLATAIGLSLTLIYEDET